MQTVDMGLSGTCVWLQEAEWDDNDSISDRQLACVIYRSSQKRIAREYLIRAQQELAMEMQRLKQLTGTA